MPKARRLPAGADSKNVASALVIPATARGGHSVERLLVEIRLTQLSLSQTHRSEQKTVPPGLKILSVDRELDISDLWFFEIIRCGFPLHDVMNIFRRGIIGPMPLRFGVCSCLPVVKTYRSCIRRHTFRTTAKMCAIYD